MSGWWELVVGLVIAVGVLGVVIPVLPGSILVFAAVGVWAFAVGSVEAMVTFALVTVLLAVAGLIKYLWPRRMLRDRGVPTSSIIVGGITGIIGFFVIPVVGLFVGFPAGVFAAELPRSGGSAAAWRSTVHATKAVALSMLVELFGALAAASVWIGAVLIT